MKNHHGTAPVPGWYSEFLGAVIRQLPRDIDPTVADSWTRNQEALQRVLRETLLPGCNTYSLIVDYERSAENAVMAGRYDWSDLDIISRNFPITRRGKSKVAVELIHFNRYISTDEALRELDRMGYRPAELNELLAFGEKYPDVQRGFPVIALGSVWLSPDGSRCVSCLDDGSGSARSLDLSWVEGDWSDLCRFAAVRK